MRSGPLSPNTHAAIEPFAAIVLIAAPWLFGFKEVSDAKTVSIVAGAVMLVGGLATQWRYALVKLIPLPVHFATDLLLGALLVLSPFLFGFSDHGAATRFVIIAGVLELINAIGTRWDPVEANAPPTPRTA